jgi:Carboxypeptidase regulatory-like domain
LNSPETGATPGPDVIVGDLTGLAQFGAAAGTQVGLAVGTDSCNFGTVDLNWFALPSNDHPVIPQNLYRMSGGTMNDERFEQIGQSSVKHAFTALTNNICSLGCNGVGGTRLGSGCSDPYSASLNSGPSLGSRAWINPFTGAYPRGDSADNPNNHTGHTHTGPSHRILTEINDLNTSLNAGATYYAESQYVTPHEFVWCQANPTQCNMNNNVSYRRYNVTGTASPFSFSAPAATVRSKIALTAWTGATITDIQPSPTTDGIGAVAYKVTNPSAGVWHYEYAVYNQNLDRAIQSFAVPLGSGVTISNLGFHAPPQQPGWAADGTVGSTGFSSTPWTQTQTATAMTWSSETLAQNPNANAIRWGTLYNFRFDSNRPPQNVTATVGFLKTGSPVTVQIQGPGAVSVPVSVSGRVMTSSGRGVANTRVVMTDASNGVRMTTTNSFGYYRFAGVPGSATYTMSVQSKRYTFTPQTMQINNNLTDVNFVSTP